MRITVVTGMADRGELEIGLPMGRHPRSTPGSSAGVISYPLEVVGVSDTPSVPVIASAGPELILIVPFTLHGFGSGSEGPLSTSVPLPTIW
jgi:hypothetical protein